ncbi:putative ATP-dependent RNA helicase [Fusarium sp. MPI-SDFR-AT-0072]|nr:putative ATP-dependent RNA helicase [Fusarium sp. MPI-SDFR-AT-0072]
MKKFGFGKKGDDGDDANRHALFGRKKSSQSSSSENPYAKQGGKDPYADDAKYANVTPYQQARAGLNNGLGAPGAQAPNSYGAPAPAQGSFNSQPQPPSGYGADRYGSGGGYGGNRYGDSAPQNRYNSPGPAAGARGPGGYGGFGPSEPDTNRDNLFAGAQERQAQKQQPTNNGPQSGADGGSYGGYGEERELTAEEQEEAEYQSILAEKRQLQQDSASSVNRSVQMARQANEVGRATLARLGAQGERLNNTEKHLDLAANQNKIAQDRAAELKTLNGSMFAVHVSNPFTSKQRKQKADDEVMARHRSEREQREATRRDGFQANQRMEGNFRDMNTVGRPRQQPRKKDYGKFNLDDEEGADELEDQIDDGITELEGQVSMMNMVGRAIGKEVDSQNKQIDRIMNKSDAVDDATRMNRERLARINTMATDNSGPPPAKKRKTKNKADPNAITIGGKTISLEGYLTAPSKAVPAASTSASDSPTAPTTTPSAAPVATTEAKKERPEHRKPPRGRDSSHRSRTRDDPKLLKTRKELPIWQYREDIQKALRKSGSDVLVLVPQFLYQEPWCRRQKIKIAGSDDEISVGGMVAITQPRRVAATTLAHRVSQEAGTPLGKGRRDGLVGYSVRFDHQVPKGSRIKFLTEGMLLQELLRDPNLRSYSAIVVDEIHERSLDVDLLVGFLKQILASDLSGRGGIPLKVVIMSATADVQGIQEFFKDVLKIKGRQYPVTVHHEPRPVPDIQDALLKTIYKIHLQEQLPGDILAFLTGQEEIEAAQKLIEEYAETLASNVPKIKVFPLYGQLSMDAQREAFLPVKTPFTRKIVLATNIAETSVTVPGVRYVVDCGKAKVKQYRARLGMESLLAKPISKSSAVQRTGRAGREGPGKCFRLYPESAFKTLQDSDLPEILRNDVLGAVLTMKARGIQDVLAFPLMDPPETEAIEKALIHLHFLGALNDDGTITRTGETMARFPISAPLGAVLLAAADPEFDCVVEAIDIISCITSGEDIFLSIQSEQDQEEVENFRKELQRREGDIITYLTTIQQYTAENADRVNWCKQRKINMRNMKQALNIRRQLRGMCLKEKLLDEAPPADPQPFVPISPERAEQVLKCFLRGFALKTAMLAPDGSFVTVQGKHVVAIHPASVLHGQKKEAIMFLEHVYTNKNYAKKVSVIQATWIVEAMGGN